MRRFLACTVLLVAAAPAWAADAFFCNDGFVQGAAAGFQLGFGPGEEAAVLIDPPASAFPLTVNFVDLFYGQNDDQSGSTETVAFYDTDGLNNLGDAGWPGTVLGSTAAPLLDSTSSLNQVALDTPLLLTRGPFWVSLRMARPVDVSNQGPGPATDGHATRPAVDGIFTGGQWVEASGLGVNGNWVIRIEGDAAAAQNDSACRIAAEGEGEGQPVGEGEGQPGGEGEGQPGGLTITSVNPSTGDVGTDLRVTVTGSGFVTGVGVRVGSAVCTDVQVLNDGALQATVPGTLPAGVYDVIAQVGASTFVFPSGFTVTAGAAGVCGCSMRGDGATFAGVGLGLLLCAARRRRHAARA